MFKKTLLTSAIVGALAMTAGTPLVGAGERSCSTTYAKKYFAECGGVETRAEPRVRVMEQYPSHPFYGDRVANGAMQPGVLTPIDSVEGDATSAAQLEQRISDSLTVLGMQEDIASNSEQIQNNSDLIDINTDRIDENSDRITENRALLDDHEVRIGNIEDQITGLSQVPAYWEPSDSETGEFRRVDDQVADPTAWTPPITTQTGDFTQSRDVTELFERVVTEYEENTVTGERRVSRVYTETEERTRTEERLVDVANNPAGGTDGYSAWANVGGVSSCSSYSPARSTVDEGQRFTQNRTCSQTQERFIYYIADERLQDQNRQTQVVPVSQSRSTTGTRVTTECNNTIIERDGVTTGWQVFSNGQTALWWGWNATGTSTNPTRFVVTGIGDPSSGNPYVRDGFEYWRTSSFMTDPRIGGANNRQFEVCRRPR